MGSLVGWLAVYAVHVFISQVEEISKAYVSLTFYCTNSQALNLNQLYTVVANGIKQVARSAVFRMSVYANNQWLIKSRVQF